ncbi:HK97-gp10 family putative phage morphogenesis protein [Lacticaseibacillus mingshuiensis]|uniref:HK97-gp10 family putative phage morphogenesis protein n=1 Tax=Lacticaseibacillus mingshuiensis TaxID=2799574 RepID=A0ABW4CFA4_9LACO|nr:HK97-gp10 family putative phage morphogenesis protein [Lacticaseibacillus mingshuiensis]
MDLNEALEQWQKQVEQAAKLTAKQQEKITKAGADVMAKKLTEATKAKHPNTKGSGGSYGHLSDDIASATGDVDGRHDGKSMAGFTKKEFVARFLNDGTKHIRGDHFVDNARDDAENEALQAEFEEYQKIIKKIGGGD